MPTRQPKKRALQKTPGTAATHRVSHSHTRKIVGGAIARSSFKWNAEQDYRLIKEVWAFTEARIAVRFVYECRDAQGRWLRAHGNEQWEFNASGLMTRREASINDVFISEEQRLLRWPLGRRPTGHPGLSELAL